MQANNRSIFKGLFVLFFVFIGPTTSYIMISLDDNVVVVADDDDVEE